jgi:hypothetical protein
MNPKEAAAREAVLKALLDVVDAEYKAARAETAKALEQAAEETGTRQVAATLPDGTVVATVSLTSGEAEARVVDEQKFTAWVRDTVAEEVERRFVTEVRPAFRKKILAELTAAGATEWADPATGVIHDVPGVEIVPARARSHRVSFRKDGRERVMQAWRDGRLTAVVLPELMAGGGAE